MAAILALVAINTLVFLGLSVAKVAPWPDPLHPRALRARAHQTGKPADENRTSAAGQLSIRQGFLLGLVVALQRLSRGPH